MYKVICLDYGHGGIIDGLYQTAGKQYHFVDEQGNFTLSFYEGVYNRQIASKLITLLLDAGYVIYDVVAGRYIHGQVSPQQLEQRDVPLSTRVRRANSIPDSIYLSLHGNAIGMSDRGPSLDARGFIAFTSEGQTASDKIAEDVIDQIDVCTQFKVRRQSATDGDSDYERQFYVLRNTNSPAVLLESGFFTNWDDAQYMNSAQGQWDIATGIFNGVSKWLYRRQPALA